MRNSRKRGRRALVFVVLGLAVAGAAPGNCADPNTAPRDTAATEVIVIGTIHDFHEKNPRYTKEILRDILVACQPGEILVELPSTMDDKPTVENGRLVNDFDKACEGWAEQKAAEQLQVPIYPCDMDRRNEVLRDNGYWRRGPQAEQEFAAWLQEHDHDKEALTDLKAIRAVSADIKESVLCFAGRGTPEIINSEAFDSMLRAYWRIREVIVPQLMKAHPEKAPLADEQRFLREQWYERNRIMVRKIVDRAKQRPGGRIAVLAGAEHRYILRDLLREQHSVTLKEYWELQDHLHR